MITLQLANNFHLVFGADSLRSQQARCPYVELLWVLSSQIQRLRVSAPTYSVDGRLYFSYALLQLVGYATASYAALLVGTQGGICLLMGASPHSLD